MDMTTTRTRYRVGGMDCASCASKIETAVKRLPGIQDVSVSVTAGTLTVTHVDRADLLALEKQVTHLGYTISPIQRAEARAEGSQGHTHGAGCGHDHAHGDHDHAPGDHGHDHARPATTTGGAARGRGSSGGDHHDHVHEVTTTGWWRTGRGRLTIACALALVAAYAIGMVVPAASTWAFATALLVGLVPIARRAFRAAFAGSPFSIEMLMTIAAIGALVIGAGEEAAAVVFLFLVGELLEGVAAGRARAGIESLAALLPSTALVERDGGKTEEVPVDRLTVGSIILVRPGDRIGADGEIVSGESAVDEAPITGESTPVDKKPGDRVFAGTIGIDGVLRVRVLAASADNTIARVIRQVEEAQESKAPTERFIDRFARWYTPAIMVVAALVAVVPPLAMGAEWSVWIYKGLALLLIGCPCALVISTPAAIAAALSAGARRGLLLKGGAALEMLGRVDAVALDKTGTLTAGRPRVTDVVGFDRPEAEILALAASLEAGSSHPLAVAILDRAEADGIAGRPVEDGRAISGKGVVGRVEGVEVFLGSARAVAERVAPDVAQAARIATLEGEGRTVSILEVNGVIAGLLALRDEPRPDAATGLGALRDLGVTTIMLTGDNARTAQAIAGDLGIDVRAELLPADKLTVVRDLQAQGRVVAKVGDGINDAPALAAADVGIAMGSGTDVALETADAAILYGRMLDIGRMIVLSRRTMRNIHQNITIALGLKAVFLVTTVAGLTGLWPAILADTGATVLVTINALRLLKAQSTEI